MFLPNDFFNLLTFHIKCFTQGCPFFVWEKGRELMEQRGKHFLSRGRTFFMLSYNGTGLICLFVFVSHDTSIFYSSNLILFHHLCGGGVIEHIMLWLINNLIADICNKT